MLSNIVGGEPELSDSSLIMGFYFLVDVTLLGLANDLRKSFWIRPSSSWSLRAFSAWLKRATILLL